MSEDKMQELLEALDKSAKGLQDFRAQLLQTPSVVETPAQVRAHAEAEINYHFGSIIGCFP